MPSNGSDSGSRLGYKAPVTRIMLPSSVYLDMLNLAYFAIYNGYGVRMLYNRLNNFSKTLKSL